jgi:hypothetical protein
MIRIYTIVIIGLLFLLVGCQEKGPMEKAGERTDEIVDNIKQGKPMLHEPGLGEKVGEAIDDTIGTGDQ